MEAASVQGFIQQVERLVRAGYVFYVQGRLEPGHQAAEVDASIASRYETELTRWSKARRYHGQGRAKVAYLRLGRDFVILATRGKSDFFRERPARFDRKGLTIFGYRLKLKGAYVQVELSQAEYRSLVSDFKRHAPSLPAEVLAQRFEELGYVPYAGVKAQLFRLLALVNRERATWGLCRLDWRCLPLTFRRVPVSHRSTFV